HLVQEVKVVADGKQYPMQTPDEDLGGQSYTIREVPLPADHVVTREEVPHVRAVVDDLGAAILNRSTLARLCHTILACWITGSFLVGAASAGWLLRGRHVESARASLKIGLTVATLACLLQMIAADSTARGVSRNQPTKLAALEGVAASQKEAPMGVVG